MLLLPGTRGPVTYVSNNAHNRRQLACLHWQNLFQAFKGHGIIKACSPEAWLVKGMASERHELRLEPRL